MVDFFIQLDVVTGSVIVAGLTFIAHRVWLFAPYFLLKFKLWRNSKYLEDGLANGKFVMRPDYKQDLDKKTIRQGEPGVKKST